MTLDIWTCFSNILKHFLSSQRRKSAQNNLQTFLEKQKDIYILSTSWDKAKKEREKKKETYTPLSLKIILNFGTRGNLYKAFRLHYHESSYQRKSGRILRCRPLISGSASSLTSYSASSLSSSYFPHHYFCSLPPLLNLTLPLSADPLPRSLLIFHLSLPQKKVSQAKKQLSFLIQRRE